MRKPSKGELGLLVGVIIATGLANADEGSLPEIVVQGYQDAPWPWLAPFADDSPLVPPQTSAPGGAYSASPNAHVNCTVGVLRSAENSNGAISPTNPAPQPTNTSLPIPIRYDNPINIGNGSKIGAQYGAINGASGQMVFPSLAAGIWAANDSMGNYAISGYSITQLVNAWAPPSSNPNAMSNTLSGLGISASMASATLLTDLTASQAEQLVAAFAWQEGYKPSGC
jgi:hypothetical protein